MLLFILAGITLVVAIRNFLKKPTLHRDNRRSDYLQTAVLNRMIDFYQDNLVKDINCIENPFLMYR